MSGQRWWEEREMLAATALLLLRVTCLVALVSIAADLVWSGIIHQGIRSAVPGLVRAESLAQLERSLDKESLLLVESSYSAPNASGVRRFLGDPAQLSAWSQLSRTLSSASSRGDEMPSLESGIRKVREEYLEIGVDLHAVQVTYIRRSLRDLSSWFVVLCFSFILPWCLQLDPEAENKAEYDGYKLLSGGSADTV